MTTKPSPAPYRLSDGHCSEGCGATTTTGHLEGCPNTNRPAPARWELWCHQGHSQPGSLIGSAPLGEPIWISRTNLPDRARPIGMVPTAVYCGKGNMGSKDGFGTSLGNGWWLAHVVPKVVG